jgi:hypothetical protein
MKDQLFELWRTCQEGESYRQVSESVHKSRQALLSEFRRAGLMPLGGKLKTKDPTPEEIAAQCRQFQDGWDEGTAKGRWVGRHSIRELSDECLGLG